MRKTVGFVIVTVTENTMTGIKIYMQVFKVHAPRFTWEKVRLASYDNQGLCVPLLSGTIILTFLLQPQKGVMIHLLMFVHYFEH